MDYNDAHDQRYGNQAVQSRVRHSLFSKGPESDNQVIDNHNNKELKDLHEETLRREKTTEKRGEILLCGDDDYNVIFPLFLYQGSR